MRHTYLDFAATSPALYEAMFSLKLSVPFGDPASPPELRFAFSQLLELFSPRTPNPEVFTELFWASLYGIADLRGTGRFPPPRPERAVEGFGENLQPSFGAIAGVSRCTTNSTLH